MEQAIMNLRLRWDLLRIIVGALSEFTFFILIDAIPSGWWILSLSALMVGTTLTILTLAQWKMVWVWSTLFVQSALFGAGLLSTLFGVTGETDVPLLLLAFLFMLVSQHVLTLLSGYSPQFSIGGSKSVMEFNVDSLKASLNHLYRRLAWDGFVFGSAFVLSVAIATMGEISPKIAILSDPSVFAIVVLIALALLVVFKEE